MTAALAAGRGGDAGDLGSLIQAAHVPPLLTVPGEDVTLRYAIVCPAPGGDLLSGRPCDASGTVYIRPGQAGPFTMLSLERGDDSAQGRWFVRVPPAIAADPAGFSYYAVLRNDATGDVLTLPAAGAAAPQRSLQLGAPAAIDLGVHGFGRVRRRDARVVGADWGGDPGEVGVSNERGAGRIGPSSFDVDRRGRVTVLDQVNRRLLRWQGARTTAIRLRYATGLADMALGRDGSIYVLDATRKPTLRVLRADGRQRSARAIAERTWAQLRVGPQGPVVQSVPSEQWMPVGNSVHLLAREAQARRARSGRLLADGTEMVVLRVGADELRVATVAAGVVQSGWRIVSRTPLGEVQLAERVGNRVVVVLKTYTDTQDEFVVLVLDGKGVSRQFSLASAQWTETAPLARFRLVGSSLYQLGSTPAGLFVDRFDLEVTQ